MTRADRGGSRTETAPAAGALAAAVALAAAAALWALFQWTELASSRSGGGQAFCGLGASCGDAWDSPFASAVQRWTGLPVAGWGLVWGVAALALPLLTLMRRAGGRPLEPFWSATLVTALGGVAAVLGLAALLFASGHLCATCLLTHVLVLLYAAVCLTQRVRLDEAARGTALALGVGALAFLGLLMPGLRTPGPGAEPGFGIAQPAPRPDVESAEPGEGAPTRPAAEGERAPLRSYLESLPPATRQAVADALARWRASPARPVRPPRSLVGPSDAPVRITEFADALCSHCASLHRTLEELRRLAPPDAFAIEPRQFPLDGACNPQIGRASDDALRCLAARAAICMEGRPGAFEFAGAVFARQRSLTESAIYAAASPYLDEAELRRCVASAETQARLQADIDWAVERDITGTPLVLVNGRRALPLPPFLYALVLARGDGDHPDFALLPPPSPDATRG